MNNNVNTNTKRELGIGVSEQHLYKVTKVTMEICSIGGGISFLIIIMSIYVLIAKKASYGVALSSAAVGLTLLGICGVSYKLLNNRG